MLSLAEAELELAVFELVDHSIDKDTHDLIFTTRTTNGFENTTRVSSNNQDYHKIVSLIARKYNDTASDNVPVIKTGETTQNKGGASACSLPKEPVTIVYDRLFNDYTHNGDLIIDLNMFIAKCLELNYEIEIRSML